MTTNQRSLILITVDCLRADHCGFYGYPRATTPFLDSLASESFVVPTAVVAGAPTYYSFPAIHASRMPLALGRDVIGLAPGESTLATVLRDSGYATAAFSAANPYLSPRFGYDQGFQIFKDFLDFASPSAATLRAREKAAAPLSESTRTRLNRSLQKAAHGLGMDSLYADLYFEYCLRIATPQSSTMDALRQFPSAETIVNHGIEFLVSTSGPFFLWLHLMDPHSPYYPSPQAFRDLTGSDASPADARYLNEYWNRSDLTPPRFAKKKNAIFDLYDAGIRSADNQIARLVAHLRQAGLWDNCTLAVTADHGEEFLEHGRRFHAPVSLHDEVARVPLLLRVPHANKKKVPATPFSHLDLAPTLLEILGAPAPQDFRGKSLWRNLKQEIPWDIPAIAECVPECTNPFRASSRVAPRLLSVRNIRHKLVIHLAPEASEQLFDLHDDPKEENPIPLTTSKDVRARFLHFARQHLHETNVQRNPATRLQARLHNLRVELGSKSH
jgi:arylsulfatase A-like enzyme